MTDADVRKRCEEVFRDATGHPSFIGRGGVDLRDVFTGMIRAAYTDGQRDGMERAAGVAKRNVYMGKECDEGGNFGGPASCEYGCGDVIADAIRQAAGEGK